MPDVKPCSVVSLLTDFGLHDDYVGEMHATICRIAPQVRVINHCHDVPPGDIVGASFLWTKGYDYYPVGTVHVGVVDPGVGSDRGIIATDIHGHIFLAPDNGLLAPLLEIHKPERVYSVENRELFLSEISNTFHGRDIFSPVAAHLATGTKIEEVGPRIFSWNEEVNIDPVTWEDGLMGRVMWIDRFGNLVTNIPESLLINKRVRIAGQFPRLVKAFYEGRLGEAVYLIGSKNTVEVGIRDGDAARTLGVGVGEQVLLVN
ncbi:SAM-dependent chlorinase/fluorinase [bacterium]|nr:SAM-dependent chlorinase/fluorinase [bacterium]